MITREELRTFFNRPNGGLEVELICAIIETWFAIAVTWSAVPILETKTIEDLFWRVPHYYVAIPWWFAGLTSGLGLWLYRTNHPACARLRWWGAILSATLWGAMFIRGIHSPGNLVTICSFFGAVWQPRIMYSAWRREMVRREAERLCHRDG